MSISLCMIVKDEEEFIEGCLKSVATEVDEIVVVDTGSQDKTKEIATMFGAQVYEMSWPNNFSIARNQSLQYATSDWILVLDADERVSANARQTLDVFIREHSGALGRVEIRSEVLDREVGFEKVTISHNTRFFPRSTSVRFTGRIHEQVIDVDAERLRVNTGLVVYHKGYNLPSHKISEKTARNMSLLKEEIQSGSSNGYYWYQLGKSYEVADQLELAKNSYELGFQLGNEHAVYFPELIMAYLYNLKSLKQEAQVWDVLARGLELYPDYPDLYFFMGKAFMEFGLYDIEMIKRAFETCLLLGEKGTKYPSVLGVGSYLAHYNLGVFYEVLGDLVHANQHYGESVKLGFTPAREALARLNAQETR